MKAKASLSFFLILLCATVWGKDPKPASQKCVTGMASLGEAAPVFERLAGAHVKDVAAGQMMLLQDTVRKRLMETRGIPSSPALRAEADKLVFSKILKDAGLKAGDSSAYQKLNDKKKEEVCRDFLARIVNVENLMKSKDADWFEKEEDGGNTVNEDYFAAKQTWVDPVRVEEWVSALDPK